MVLDTLTADHVSAYGYRRDTTRHLDGLAAEGVLFEAAISNSAWTLPAMAAMLSGRFPSSEVFAGKLERSLVERLEEAGVTTAAFTEGGFVSAFYGFERGFDVWSEVEGEIRLKVAGQYLQEEHGGGVEQTFATAQRWLRANGNRRFFLFVHTYEVHSPYRRRDYAMGLDPAGLGRTFELEDLKRLRKGELRLTPERLRYLQALYDGGVRAADAQLGALLGTLKEIGRAGDTLVVVTSDHGEELGGRIPRFTGDHGHVLYDDLIRVPLVVRDPRVGNTPSRVGTQVRTVDVLPTVLEGLGVPVPEGLDGRSLVPLIAGGEEEHRPAISTLTESGGKPPRRALRNGRYKLIVSDPDAFPIREAVELFDLARDVDERMNLAERDPALRDQLRADLDAWLDRIQRSGPADYGDPEEAPEALRARLEALGYLVD